MTYREDKGKRLRVPKGHSSSFEKEKKLDKQNLISNFDPERFIPSKIKDSVAAKKVLQRKSAAVAKLLLAALKRL